MPGLLVTPLLGQQVASHVTLVSTFGVTWGRFWPGVEQAWSSRGAGAEQAWNRLGGVFFGCLFGVSTPQTLKSQFLVVLSPQKSCEKFIQNDVEHQNLTNVSRNRMKHRFRNLAFAINFWFLFYVQHDWDLRFEGARAMASTMHKHAQTQHLEIADSSRDLRKI